MKSSKYTLSSFFKEVQGNYYGLSIGSNEDFLKKISLKTGDFFFVLDLAKNKIVHFEGLKEMLGYDQKEIDLPFIFDKLHPEDSVLVQSLIKNIVGELLKLNIPRFTNVFKLKLRFAKASGEYTSIIGDNFILHLNEDNIVETILIRFTDVSFLDNPDPLNWWVNEDYLSKEHISNMVYGSKKFIFTVREKEIILLILKGISNKRIAGKLNISHHTVATHRKNILSKANCSGVAELELFCKNNGVFEG